jgi:hypothetical protein
MKKIVVTKTRKTQSGSFLPQFNQEIKMTISSMCPAKWLFVDLETGDVWRIKEGEFNQKDNFHFWRAANRSELQELEQLTYNI